MKAAQKDSEKAAAVAAMASSQNKALAKLMGWLILFVFATFVVYTLKLINSPSPSACDEKIEIRNAFWTNVQDKDSVFYPIEERKDLNVSSNSSKSLEIGEAREKTELKHIMFGIAASSKLWESRKNYIKLWWKPKEMRGIVWLDNKVKTRHDDNLPKIKISGDTSKFAYKNKQGHRSAIRISRIVSETLRLGNTEGVRWFVMGDDDTVFVTENLVRVLNKYDHNQFYYIGSLSESHLQNIYFSYGMAYGGGGFAISYPLAKALEKMQDLCIQRYPGLYGSDDRMQACMAELGVPLTKELGFHQVVQLNFKPTDHALDKSSNAGTLSLVDGNQYDVYGNLFGLLASHPVTPLVSLHHLDVVEPIFPNVTRVQALQRLKIPMKLDSAGLIQQSICYDKKKTWTVSVSWGFAVQVFRGVLSPREVEMPSRTFLNWYKRADYTAYAFNTRPVSRNPCQKPFVFYMTKAKLDSLTNQTVSEYARHRVPHPDCRWKMANPADLDRVEVLKKPDPHLWDRSPRRNCCRVLESKRKSLVIDVGVCGEGEISEV